MKPPIIVGTVIAIVITAGAVFAPALRSSASKNAAQAAIEAEYARRLLSDAGARVANALMASELAALTEADLTSLVEASSESLADLSAEFRKAVDLINKADRKYRGRGDGAGLLEPVDTSLGGVRAAIGAFKSRVAEDLELLKNAELAAQQADQSGANPMAVKHIIGMVHYLKASIALAESMRYRKQLVAQRDEMLQVGAGLMLAQANVDQYRGLDVTEIVARLQTSLEQATAAENEANTEAESLQADVTRRERELQDVSSKLVALRGRLLSHQQTGFTAGDDDSFAAYRQEHLAIDQSLSERQAQEQTLRFGGLRGADFDSQDLATAAITGGEPVVALSELKWRLADAGRRAEGYRASRESAEQSIASMRAIGVAAGGKQADYESRIAKLREQLTEVLASKKTILEGAMEEEKNALKSGREARDAFAAADRAAAKWVSDAASLRSELDPDRLNERLGDISGDQFVKRIGSSSEAAALMLIARVDAQRISDFERELAARTQFMEFVPGMDFGSTEAIDRVIATAREDGTTELKKAIDIFDQLARGAGSTEWVHQTALAAAQYLLSKIDIQNADQHFSDALATIEAAVAGQEHSPYLAQHVRFRNHLKAIADAKAGPAIDPGEFGEDD